MNSNVHTALFTVDKIWKQPKCPLTDKKDAAAIYIHICIYEYYSAIK